MFQKFSKKPYLKPNDNLSMLILEYYNLINI